MEDTDGARNAERKLREKRLDAIVLNTPAAISAPTSAVDVLVAGAGWEAWPEAGKGRTAARLVRLVEQLHAARMARRSAPADQPQSQAKRSRK